MDPEARPCRATTTMRTRGLGRTPSRGPAVTAGVKYHINQRWHIVASYSVAQVNSTLTTDTAGVFRTSSVHFWPNAVVLSVGYSFGL